MHNIFSYLELNIIITILSYKSINKKYIFKRVHPMNSIMNLNLKKNMNNKFKASQMLFYQRHLFRVDFESIKIPLLL